MPPIDFAWLERALALAERARYTVSPNPMVGAVVVRAGTAVGEGFHRRAGGPHAEVVALRRAGAAARGADLYLTLEPCVSQGRTPACAPAVIASGVRRVVVAATDPNPLVAGRGVRALRRAGLEVVLARAPWRGRALDQNEKFRASIARGWPFVLAKWASTLDGRIASAKGESRWITGEAARRRGLELREEYDAVLVGAGTVLADDPRLTRRLAKARGLAHWRIVLDGRLRVPESARALRGAGERLVVTAASPDHPKARRLSRRGIRVWSLPGRPGGSVDLRRLLVELSRHGVTSLMVEGGGQTLGSFFESGLVDKVAAFLAPRVLGGRGATGAVGGTGFALADAPELARARVERVGADLLVTGRLA
ncbi:MAG TPA: bifunctional diaminohydroxyphosphoribosylaminopyrimidine deaminase/5-amino-6-(5-phosphoribosylamino)uracil reductase RibD [Thermoanaerobaculia bacterium]|jgi:diaminohydroxyphosphoribosylaminopyrimidine deaminase/5-amino-6-(5-phosphoribosylamino)uracil reductase|nr:bifunctional diaminohydroxyphosphoribosylaminopyrimidine deaminase/5-amino-6-(5-phosphoribosylamino)uracil reductase RibD [Thermoanaerobaculia bacterium]